MMRCYLPNTTLCQKMLRCCQTALFIIMIKNIKNSLLNVIYCLGWLTLHFLIHVAVIPTVLTSEQTFTLQCQVVTQIKEIVHVSVLQIFHSVMRQQNMPPDKGPQPTEIRSATHLLRITKLQQVSLKLKKNHENTIFQTHQEQTLINAEMSGISEFCC